MPHARGRDVEEEAQQTRRRSASERGFRLRRNQTRFRFLRASFAVEASRSGRQENLSLLFFGLSKDLCGARCVTMSAPLCMFYVLREAEPPLPLTELREFELAMNARVETEDERLEESMLLLACADCLSNYVVEPAPDGGSLGFLRRRRRGVRPMSARALLAASTPTAEIWLGGERTLWRGGCCRRASCVPRLRLKVTEVAQKGPIEQGGAKRQ